MTQPTTARQLQIQTGLTLDQCSYLLCKLSRNGFLSCLNPKSRRGRVYWLSKKGLARKERTNLNLDDNDVPRINWNLYGAICFSHRAIVVRTLRGPMQPATIKRLALRNNPNIRFSANNCRDVIRFLKANRIVQPIYVRKKHHPRYELTEEGKHMQRLLWQSEVKRF